MVQKRVKAAKLHIYYEVCGQDLRITAHEHSDVRASVKVDMEIRREKQMQEGLQL